MTGRVKVVFASLLKPVDEPRMYGKLARSLGQTNKYDINIIGFRPKNMPSDESIAFWPLFDFPRISLSRLLAPLTYLRKILQLKPDLIVLTSPDFLMVSSLYKILFGCRLVYDVQENYYRNIIWSHGTPSLLRKLRASLVTAKEAIADRIIIQYLLAERCYSIECSFISKPALVLENKVRKPSAVDYLPLPVDGTLRLLYSGTIAESYGVMDAIQLAEVIYELSPNMKLIICGHCPSGELFERLTEMALTRPWLVLKTATTPIPYNEILLELAAAHFVLVSYRLNPSNQHCMPTRIWEALAWKKPMILRREHPWLSFVQQYEGGFAIDFLYPDRRLLEEGLFGQAYYTKPLPEEVYWESQEQEWIELVAVLTEDL
jgi:glycosyltransferase involved in cell wall biosynthesis